MGGRGDRLRFRVGLGTVSKARCVNSCAARIWLSVNEILASQRQQSASCSQMRMVIGAEQSGQVQSREFPLSQISPSLVSIRWIAVCERSFSEETRDSNDRGDVAIEGPERWIWGSWEVGRLRIRWKAWLVDGDERSSWSIRLRTFSSRPMTVFLSLAIGIQLDGTSVVNSLLVTPLPGVKFYRAGRSSARSLSS